MQLHESPLFQQMKAEGKTSKAPITELLLQERQDRAAGAAGGATAGQAVVWYTGQFYAMFFLSQSLKVDATTTWLMIAHRAGAGYPFFIFFGWLSDRIGRKWIIMVGCLVAALTYMPLFKALTRTTPTRRSRKPAAAHRQWSTPIPTCSFQFDPVGKKKFTNSCDIATAALAKAGIPYTIQPVAAGTVARVSVGGTDVASYEGAGLAGDDAKAKGEGVRQGAEGGVDLGGLSGEGRPGAHQQADGGGNPDPAGDLRDHGLRPDRGVAGELVPRPASATPRCRCRTTSAAAGSAASCRPSPSPWSRPPATSTTACGTRS